MTVEAQENQRVDESMKWYKTLVSYREKLNELKENLYYFSPGRTDLDAKVGIDHFHNQFHIQLVNIHDLKHDLKIHKQVVSKPDGQFSPAAHTEMKERVEYLTEYLDNLENEYNEFLALHKW
jgi:hypothetical protein